MESIAWKAKEIYGTAKAALTNDESLQHTRTHNHRNTFAHSVNLHRYQTTIEKPTKKNAYTHAVHTHVVRQAGVKHDALINNGW